MTDMESRAWEYVKRNGEIQVGDLIDFAKSEVERATGGESEILLMRDRAEKAEAEVASLHQSLKECEGQRRVAEQNELDLTKMVEDLRSNMEKMESCICHRIPSKNWHLERCPARTAPQDKEGE